MLPPAHVTIEVVVERLLAWELAVRAGVLVRGVHGACPAAE